MIFFVVFPLLTFSVYFFICYRNNCLFRKGFSYEMFDIIHASSIRYAGECLTEAFGKVKYEL